MSLEIDWESDSLSLLKHTIEERGARDSGGLGADRNLRSFLIFVCTRFIRVWNLFFTSLSERPGRSLLICVHLFPTSR